MTVRAVSHVLQDTAGTGGLKKQGAGRPVCLAGLPADVPVVDSKWLMDSISSLQLQDLDAYRLLVDTDS